MYIVAELLSFAVAFALTYIYGKSHSELLAPAPVAAPSEPKAVTEAKNEAKRVSDKQDQIVFAPIDGHSIDLSEVNDQVFSTKMMGDGAAIVPTDGTIYAPVDGEITVAYETKHAYGIKSADGAEVLIHVGIDTVNLKGEHFTSNVTQGQKIKKGDILGTADLKAIQEAGYDTTVMVIITNTMNYEGVARIEQTDVKHGDDLIAITAVTEN